MHDQFCTSVGWCGTAIVVTFKVCENSAGNNEPSGMLKGRNEMTETRESARGDITKIEKRADDLHDALKFVVSALEPRPQARKLDLSSIPAHIPRS
jgi:hypothetical protein